VDLEAYRHSAESFLSVLTLEYYGHYAGLKDGFEIEPIYERHAELFTASAVDELQAIEDRAQPDSEERRRLTMLLDFAVEGYLGQATKRVEAELAVREAELMLELDGDSVGFRESDVIQANEADAERRAQIERARLEAIETQLNGLYAELIGTHHELARQLGFTSYRELCARCKRIDLGDLQEQTSAFTRRTGPRYPEVVDQPLRAALGFGLEALRRSDIGRFMRAPELDSAFPAAQLIPSFEQTLRGLGIDIHAQPGVALDLESRPKKSPRAFCAPVRVPGEVYLVLAPTGGHDDYCGLFHEGGHTEHYASVDRNLPFEFRMLGDNSVTEAFAFLFMHLVEDPEWLARHLGVADPEPVAAHGRAVRLIYLRRYAAKLAYELELHNADGSLAEFAPRYGAIMSAALEIDWPVQSYLADVDPGFYCACYLRAWALETHLRHHLRSRYGEAWFERREAGDELRALWREGQRLTPEELLAGLSAERLRFEVLVDDLAL